MLETLAAIAEDIGSTGTAREVRELAARSTERRFFVAAVGQFKRGKSTLLNALIGEPLLPAGVAPVTSAITVIRYGHERAARVIFRDGRTTPVSLQDVQLYVSESENPENRRAVAVVEIFSPSPLLAQGLCLIDTPGLGSIFQGNTEETRAFVPRIDAAIVVLGADPPIGADELALVDAIAQQVDDIVVVINKSDRLSRTDLDDARRFTQEVFARQLGRKNEPLLEISAAERTAGAVTRDWAALEDRLRALASRADAMIAGAARRGTERLAARILHDLAEQDDALRRPIADSERRVAALEASTAQSTRLLSDLSALFAAEEQRIASRLFETAAEDFVRSSKSGVEQDILDAIDRLAPDDAGGALRQHLYAAARDIASRRALAWLKDLAPAAETQYRQAAGRFIDLANAFLASLRASGDPAFLQLPASLSPDAGFRAAPRFYFTDLMYLTGGSLTGWIVDHLGSRSASHRAATRDALTYAERLLHTNSSRALFDLRDRLSASRRDLETELKQMLSGMAESAARALRRAQRARNEGEAVLARELDRIEAHRATIRALTAGFDTAELPPVRS